MASGALILNEKGDILIVKPTYRPEWLIPGGVVEMDESPYEACQREVREELGLNLQIGRLLCVAYYPPLAPWREIMQYIFFGGTLSQQQITSVVPEAQELAEIRFAGPKDASNLLDPRLALLVNASLGALSEGRLVYLENGISPARDLYIANYDKN